jgi:hypothetical protein
MKTEEEVRNMLNRSIAYQYEYARKYGKASHSSEVGVTVLRWVLGDDVNASY